MKILNDKELDKLMALINEHGLEPSWMNYGGFSKPFVEFGYHPEYRKKVKHLNGMYKISVGTIIYQLTDKEYNVYITPEQNERFNDFISEIKNRDQFKNDLIDLYNSYTYEYTVYSKAFLDVSWGNKWYSTNIMDTHLPLDASKNRDDILKSKAESKAKNMVANMEKNGKYVDGYQVEKIYTDVHYRKEEWHEILEMGKQFRDNHPTHQSRRVLTKNVSNRIDDFVPVKLKTSGRLMLMDMHVWGWSFIEEDPIIV